MEINSVDVAILGGGMVGLTLAAALEQSGLTVAVVEAGHTPHVDERQRDNRVSALSRASEHILTAVKAWPAIVQGAHGLYDAMQVWERDGNAKLDFSAMRIGQPNLGYIVENRRISQALWQRCEKLSHIQLLTGMRCERIQYGRQEAWLMLRQSKDDAQGGEKSLTAKLVVGADGANSWLRQQMAVPMLQWDYDHHALVATIETELAHDNVARQIFSSQGPLAFLPLEQSHLSAIVWSLPPEQAQRMLNADITEFERHLTVAFDHRLGLCKLQGERQVHPLKMRYARDLVQARAVLIGDAAHTIHPLAGQGVNLGLQDAAALAQTLRELHRQQQDIGDPQVLASYARWRKTEAATMIASMQGFHDLFAGNNPLKKGIRQLGMQLVSRCEPLKDQLLYRALGLTGELPEMAKG
ncbi:FAD-dependent monooxygenase [Vibrio stylophorae]|nr:FAD-dependent monooxygenase [Vibrio stylophorae]